MWHCMYFFFWDMIELLWKGSKLTQLIGSSGIIPCLSYHLSKMCAVLVQGLLQGPILHLAEVTSLSWSSAVCQGQLHLTVAGEDWWRAIAFSTWNASEALPFRCFSCILWHEDFGMKLTRLGIWSALLWCCYFCHYSYRYIMLAGYISLLFSVFHSFLLEKGVIIFIGSA